jgi:cytochrome c oxidase subunit 2
MKVDLYEKIWMWGVGGMLLLFFGSLARAALTQDLHPPSHVETINPSTVLRDPRFTTQGVRVDEDGRIHVWVVSLMYVFLPGEVTVPADTPITFHLTSVDVVHGFQVVRTNGQVMVVPGYVSRFTTRFAPGEYLIACNEYCGIGHHTMMGKLHVVPREEWTPPAAVGGASTAEGGSHAGH